MGMVMLLIDATKANAVFRELHPCSHHRSNYSKTQDLPGAAAGSISVSFVLLAGLHFLKERLLSASRFKREML
jgi:hypothetical protein